MPVFALLLAQLATTVRRSAALLAVATVTSAVILQGMVSRFDPVVGTGDTPPRSIQPLLTALDRLQVAHAYADYWIAYRIDFDSDERIIAVESKFKRLVRQGGDVAPPRNPVVRYKPYEDEVRRSRHAFVFFRSTRLPPAFKATLARYGYARHHVQSFVIYARRSSA
jgi:hypothetical protein